ncbi:MAG: hypothetical protein U1E45_03905 [Geminicoccaceae bacterium]
MPTTPSPAQSEASRRNGAGSRGPVTEAGKARSSLNGVSHGLCGETFFLLPDEDPAEFERYEAMWLAHWCPRDGPEWQAALAVVRCRWRERRADRLEALVMGDLFAAEEIEDAAMRDAAKAAGLKALNTVLRYRARLAREQRDALATLDALRDRALTEDTERTRAQTVDGAPAIGSTVSERSASRLSVAPSAALEAKMPNEPEPIGLNRRQRRALAALERRSSRIAA